MKIADFFINISTKGDTRELDKTIQKMEQAQAKEKARVQFKEKILRINKLIEKATKTEQIERLKNIKNQIRDNYVNQVRLTRLKDQNAALKEQHAHWVGMVRGVAAFAASIGTALVLMDKLSNSVLKTNQLYTNFSRQTGISIGSLNKMAGVAKLSGMNLPVEQVANDLNNLQQKIFRLEKFGQGSDIFAQLGMNPIGMNSDQFVTALRQRFKTMSAESKSYALDMLGLSREWLNVLDLSDKEYNDLIKASSKLQLKDEERQKIAEYTLIQQKSNMRYELAKQRLLIALLPIMTKITELASTIAEKFANSFGNEKGVAVIRDIAFWLGIAAVRAGAIKKALSVVAGLGAIFGVGGKKTALKGMAGVGLKTAGKGVLGAAAGPLGWILLATTVFDIFGLLKQWFQKDTEADENEPPTDIPPGLQYASVSSSMVNHFYNNPAPHQAIENELTNFANFYLRNAKK